MFMYFWLTKMVGWTPVTVINVPKLLWLGSRCTFFLSWFRSHDVNVCCSLHSRILILMNHDWQMILLIKLVAITFCILLV